MFTGDGLAGASRPPRFSEFFSDAMCTCYADSDTGDPELCLACKSYHLHTIHEWRGADFIRGR